MAPVFSSPVFFFLQKLLRIGHVLHVMRYFLLTKGKNFLRRTEFVKNLLKKKRREELENALVTCVLTLVDVNYW